MYQSKLNGDRISFVDQEGVPNIQIVVSSDTQTQGAPKPVLEFKGKNAKPLRMKKTKPVKKESITTTTETLNIFLDMNTDTDFFVNIDSNSVENLNFINLKSGQIGSVVITATVQIPALKFLVNGFDTNVNWLSGSTTVKTRAISEGVSIYKYTVRDNVIGIWNVNAISTEVTSSVVEEEEPVYTPVDTVQSTVHTFSYTGSVQQVTLPTNVNTATIYAWGAGGSGGNGGYTQSTVTFPSLGQTVYLVVGKAGDASSGGGATVIYYIDDTGRKRDVIVAGGGGSKSSAGGLVGQGTLPGTQLSGTITPGYMTGIGLTDGSGGGYYGGVSGSGGSGFIGSNVILENFGVTQVGYGTQTKLRDSSQRFDAYSRIAYKNTVTIDSSGTVSDYYHNEANPDNKLGSIGQNGFAYISFDIKSNTNISGISSLVNASGKITPTLETASLSTHWKYFIHEYGIVSESQILPITTPFTITSLFGKKTIHAYGTNSDGSEIYGNIRKLEISNNESQENVSVEFKNGTVTVNTVDGKTDPREVENGDHFSIVVKDVYLESSFVFKTYDLPFTFSISHGTILNLYCDIENSLSEKLTASHFGTVRTSFVEQNAVPGITGLITLPVTKDTTFEVFSNENYTFTTGAGVLIVTLGSNDETNWVVKSVTTTTVSKGSIEFDHKTYSEASFSYIKVVTYKEPEGPVSVLSIQTSGMEFVENKNIVMLGSVDNVNWNILSITTNTKNLNTGSKILNVQKLSETAYTYVKLVNLQLPPEPERLMSIQSTIFDFPTDKKTVIMGSNDNLNWVILSISDLDINSDSTSVNVASYTTESYRYVKGFRISA